MKVLKKILLALAIMLGAVLLCAVGLFTWLTITEYRPAPEEWLPVYTVLERDPNDPSSTEPIWSVTEHGPALDQQRFTVLSWNIGYCGLGRESDFFMDGGKETRPPSEERVLGNLEGVQALLAEHDADFIMLQEVDSDSHRSYGVDQVSALREQLRNRQSSYALNFACAFVPIPLPPIGEVHSGLLSISRYDFPIATRLSLPCPFSWPVSIANLKRCLLVTRVPLENSDKELVLVNLHLEAYDDGEGKLAQSKQLRDFVRQEYEKGNYVVAGGDWNQSFPNAETKYPNTHRELWTPGCLEEAELDAGWRYVWDDSVPSCRLLNQPYDPTDEEHTQYYVIDGFLISPNLRVESVQTLDEGFACSDHNPVLLTLTMGDMS